MKTDSRKPGFNNTMKRYGFLFEKICDPDNLYQAFLHARRGKGWYDEVKLISERPWYYLAALRDKLINGEYHTSEYTMFLRQEGKKTREIYKLPFYPDRIVHWAILQVIEPILLNSFTSDTYSAIPGRGIHAAAKNLRHDLDIHPDEMSITVKTDCQKFYQSITHDILMEKFRKLFKDEKLLALLEEIVRSISTCPATEENIEYYSRWGPVKIIDRNGLKYIDGIGIPIGNYLSQYEANFYLSDFDHWLKEDQGVRFCYRYMDDETICLPDKPMAHRVLDNMREYLDEHDHIRLKDNYQIFPTFVRGIDFVGYRFFKDYTLLRKSTATELKRKMAKIIEKGRSGKDLSFHEYCCVNSYAGWLKFCDGKNLEKKYIEPAMVYAGQYYDAHLRKRGKDHERLWDSREYCEA